MLSDSLLTLTARDGPTVTSELAKAPNKKVELVVEELYKPKHAKVEKLLDKLHLGKSKEKGGEVTKEDLDIAARCGDWEGRPSDLFLKMYADVLLTIEKDPLAGLVSPPLLGSTGVIPLSIVSVIPDIIDHMADVIVRAKHEIFFATNFWEASDSATTITDAFKELSRRAGERGDRVVIKLMYDRGTPKQVVDNHQFVEPKDYTGERVKLPAPNEIPNIDLEVVNYHVPPVGTFHAKYVVIDREIVILQSNNIQDRVNVEMMTHIEGPIVQSFYDMALLSWNNAMNPPLPLLNQPPPKPTSYDFGDEHVDIQKKDVGATEDHSRALLMEHHEYATGVNGDAEKDARGGKVYDATNADESRRLQAALHDEAAVSAHLNTGTPISATAKEDGTKGHQKFKPLVLHERHDPVPMALVNRRPKGTPGHGDVENSQDAAFLAAFKYAEKQVFIQTPTFNGPPIVEAALEAVRRGVEVIIFADLGFNDEGELLPMQGGTNEMVAEKMYKELGDNEEAKKLLRWFWYTGKDQATPLNAKDKSRNCHVKLMIVDEHVGIQGNGNQDVQSWFHSQEINVMVDSAEICKEWFFAMHSNQNTHLHGELQKDGIWRDSEGKKLPGATGAPKGPFKSLIGVKGAVQRVRGEGGF
ncbi:hypothetical protein MNV49_006416 [Pseudohyphozyma bogoriensis]|nr:hypothetical protein MNV49_006416 [Pseudohyphozyma bogoriensis]